MRKKKPKVVAKFTITRLSDGRIQHDLAGDPAPDLIVGLGLLGHALIAMVKAMAGVPGVETK